MKNTNKTARLGDVVSGEYSEVPFEGTFTYVDGNGYLHIKLTEEIVVYGIPRQSIAIGPWRREELVVVSRPALTEANIVDGGTMGGVRYAA